MTPGAFTFPQAQTLRNPVGIAGPRSSGNPVASQGFGATPWCSSQGAKTDFMCRNPGASTKGVIRGLRVLIEVKVLKYHEVTRFQNRSGSFTEQHIAAWIEQLVFVICQGEQTYRKGVESSQQTNHKHSKTN